MGNKKSGSVKGLIFKNTKTWLLKEYGNKGLNDFVKSLPVEEQLFWIGPEISPVAWWPAQMFDHVYEIVNKLWGKKDPDVFKKGAAFVAFQDLSKIMKMFMKLGSPSTIAGRFPLVWRHYFDTGMVRIINKTTNSISIEIIGAAGYGLAGCTSAIGWTTMALEYSGAKNLKVEHPRCIFNDGHSTCLVQYAWD